MLLSDTDSKSELELQISRAPDKSNCREVTSYSTLSNDISLFLSRPPPLLLPLVSILPPAGFINISLEHPPLESAASTSHVGSPAVYLCNATCMS